MSDRPQKPGQDADQLPADPSSAEDAPVDQRLEETIAANEASPTDLDLGMDLASDLEMTGSFRPGQSGSSSAQPFAVESQIVPVDAENKTYQVDHEVARGGMGVILKVRDEKLQRDLAMKIIRGQEDLGTHSAEEVNPDTIDRFMREAEITGQLEHPGVVPVHDIGTDQLGRKYFTMRLVIGDNLHEIYRLVRDPDSPWTQTRVLDILVKVCDTLAYAHSKDIIHRDLKPGNVMVGPFGETYVMDWGLAKVLHSSEAKLEESVEGGYASGADGESEHPSYVARGSETMAGSILGTPAYMPPEQAAGRIGQLDARSDVFSVGTMLYQLVVGHRPYGDMDHQTGRQVIDAVINGPPTSIVQLNTNCPPELVAICEKAMQRSKADRYQSVAEMGEDLRAFLEQRVVRAYRTGTWAELKKWVRRNRGFTISTVAAVLVALIGMAAAIGIQIIKNQQLTVANTNKTKALKDRSIALGQARASRGVAIEERNNARAQQRRAEGAYLARRSAEILESNPGLALLMAREAYARHDDLATRNAVHAARAASVESHTLLGHLGEVWQVVFSPDERHVAVVSDDSSASVWDVATGQRVTTLIGHGNVIRSIAWSHDGRQVATGSFDGTAALWNAETGQRIHRFVGQQSEIRQVDLSADGKWLATAARNDTRLWDVVTGSLVRTIPCPALSVRFSPDSKLLVVGNIGGRVEVHNLATSEHREMQHEGGDVYRIVFSSSGDRMLTSDRFGAGTVAYVWDLQSGELLQKLAGHEGGLRAADLGTDGEIAITGGEDGVVRIWNTTTGQVTQSFSLSNPIHSADLSADGTFVAAAAGAVGYVWRISAGAEPLLLRGHDQTIHDLNISRDGTHVATASADNSGRLWNPFLERSVPWLVSPDGQRRAPLVSPQGDRLLTLGSEHSNAFLWSLPEGNLVASLPHDSGVALGVFDSENQRIVTTSVAGKLRMWDSRTGIPLLEFEATAARAIPVVEHSTGRLAVPNRQQNRVDYWSLDTGQQLPSHELGEARSIRPTGTPEQWVVTRPSGDAVLVSLEDGEARESSLPTGRLWTAGDRLLLAPTGGGNIQIINLDSHNTEGELTGSPFAPLNAFFDREHRRVAITASRSGTVFLWNIGSGNTPLELPGHTSSNITVRFIDGSDSLLTICDGKITLWDRAGRPTQLDGAVTAPISTVTVVKGAPFIAMGHASGEMSVWSHSGQLRAVVDGGVRSLHAAAEQRVVSADENGNLSVWDLTDRVLEDTTVPREFTTRELQSLRDAFDDEALLAKQIPALENGSLGILKEVVARAQDNPLSDHSRLAYRAVWMLKQELLAIDSPPLTEKVVATIEQQIDALPRPIVAVLHDMAELHAARSDHLRAVSVMERVVLLSSAMLPHHEALEQYRAELNPGDHTYRSIDAALAQRADNETIDALQRELPAAERNYLRARLAVSDAKPKSALGHLETTLAKNPESFEPYLFMAEVLAELKRPREAERVLRRALEGRPCPYFVWHRWLQLQFHDLQNTPQEILAAFPSGLDATAVFGRSGSAECRQLLETLANQSALRVNSGGAAYDGGEDHMWVADAYYTDGRRFNEGQGPERSYNPIANTEHDLLYQTERYFVARPDRMRQGYRIPVPNGRWQVRLHFAEIHFDEPGHRLFDVAIEDQTLLSNHDPSAAGVNTAHTRDFDVIVKDGSIDIFFDAPVELPKISAIEIRAL